MTVSSYIATSPGQRVFSIFAPGTISATTQVMVQFEPIDAEGLVVVVNTTAFTGTTPSLTVLLQGWDPIAGVAYTLGSGSGLTTGSITTATTNKLSIIQFGTNTSALAQDFVPPHLLVTATIGGTASPTVTCSVTALVDL